MLTALAEQVRRLSNRMSGPVELFLVHDAEEASATDTLAEVHAAIGDFPGRVEALPCTGLDYYQQKNFGASRASGQLILLADSDIIPEDGWLERLLTCLEEEKADVVCGATHLETNTFYEKAFAGFWFFPLPSETPARQRSEHFFANNVVFRAEVLRDHPFADLPLVRGKCLLLARDLIADGKSIFIEPAARVTHPPPNGAWHFIKRALCSGQDNVFLRDEDNGPGGAFRRLRWQVRDAGRRLAANRREIGLGPLGVAAGGALAAVYFLFEFAGDLLTQARPGLIRDNLRV